jgi:nicotinamide phosphoribosyltransferase
MNPLFLKDYYKADHRRQYPDDTKLIYSNMTARQSRLPDVDKVVFFGLQYAIKRYLIEEFNNKFFSVDENLAVSRYKRMMDFTLGKDAIDVSHIKALHKLGYLPVLIKAVAEGVEVPIKVPMFTIRNTHPEFAWVTNFLETLISQVVWPMINSATLAHRFRKLCDTWCENTWGDADFTQWQGHDFSARGMFGPEAAFMSGMAHLLSFTGTDTISAIEALETYYNANIEKELVGSSVYATEHSVMCAGTKEGEFDTYERLLTKVYPSGIVSIVSDTWDLWNVVDNYLPKLKDIILARKGKLVIRPDTGDPVDILCGSTERLVDISFKRKGLIERLWDIFGGTVNEKGFKVLDPHIGAIYGDSITYERAEAIFSRLADKGFASTNIVLGIGSFYYQYNTRDTFGQAIKATYAEIGNDQRELFKDPITDNGAAKKSAKGLLAVMLDKNGELTLKEGCNEKEENEGMLTPVFENSVLLEDYTLEEIRDTLTAFRE